MKALIEGILRHIFGERRPASDEHDETDHHDNAAIVSALQELRAEVKRQTAAAQQYHRHDGQKLWAGWLSLAVNAITMGAVIIYACYAKGQLDEMRHAVEISRQALDANERAWVLVQPQGFALRPQPVAGNSQGYPLLNGVMVNSGKSPAFRVVYVARVSFELARPDIPPEDSGEWTEASGLDLAPGGGNGSTSLLYASFGPKGFPPKKYAAVEKGDLTLFLWVFVRYSDPFSGDRFTQKCVRHSPQWRVGNPGSGGAALSGLILCPSRYQIHR